MSRYSCIQFVIVWYMSASVYEVFLGEDSRQYCCFSIFNIPTCKYIL